MGLKAHSLFLWNHFGRAEGGSDYFRQFIYHHFIPTCLNFRLKPYPDHLQRYSHSRFSCKRLAAYNVSTSKLLLTVKSWLLVSTDMIRLAGADERWVQETEVAVEVDGVGVVVEVDSAVEVEEEVVDQVTEADSVDEAEADHRGEEDRAAAGVSTHLTKTLQTPF